MAHPGPPLESPLLSGNELCAGATVRVPTEGYDECHLWHAYHRFATTGLDVCIFTRFHVNCEVRPLCSFTKFKLMMSHQSKELHGALGHGLNPSLGNYGHKCLGIWTDNLQSETAVNLLCSNKPPAGYSVCVRLFLTQQNVSWGVTNLHIPAYWNLSFSQSSPCNYT